MINFRVPLNIVAGPVCNLLVFRLMIKYIYLWFVLFVFVGPVFANISKTFTYFLSVLSSSCRILLSSSRMSLFISCKMK